MRNVKIVCTLGPASSSRATIRAMADAGMTVGRINASHGTLDERIELLETTRHVDEVTDRPVATMVDLQGPEIRTATVEEPFEIESGTTVRFVQGEDATPEEVGLSSSIAAVEPGDRVLLDDGRIEAIVGEVDGETVQARIESGGQLRSRVGVNIPGVALDLEVVTEKDRRDLEFAAEYDADFVAASFVRNADDVFAVGEVLEEFGADVPIIAKIERAGAVENLPEIIEASAGIMVARGDLGVECPLEDVPMIQKRIIRRCQEAGVPVITATEMLDSMVHARRPTRAEASDVANAVLDGTDAVMLSAETAIGDHPVRVVETMARIVREVEGSQEYQEVLEQRVPPADRSSTGALARSARYLARDLGASAVVVASESGYTALKTAKFRPGVPVVAATPNHRVRRQLALSWGVQPQHADLAGKGADDVIETAVQSALDSGVAKSGDTVVVLSGMMTELEDAVTTNMLKVHVAAETLTTGRSVVAGRVAGPLVRLSDGDLSSVPNGAIVALPAGFDDEFTGDVHRLAAIVDARGGMTGYPALVARELGIPMVSGATVPDRIEDGRTVTIDAERGVIYDGNVARPRPVGQDADHSE